MPGHLEHQNNKTRRRVCKQIIVNITQKPQLILC